MDREEPSTSVQTGGRWPYLHEQQVLTGSVIRKVAWVKGSFSSGDLAELARLRQTQNLTCRQLAAHFQVGLTTVVARLRDLRRARSTK